MGQMKRFQMALDEARELLARKQDNPEAVSDSEILQEVRSLFEFIPEKETHPALPVIRQLLIN